MSNATTTKEIDMDNNNNNTMSDAVLADMANDLVLERVRYQVIEDLGGNLLLLSYGTDNILCNGCYVRPEDMGACIKHLVVQDGDISHWDNLEADPAKTYEDATGSWIEDKGCDYGWTTVCTQDGLINQGRWGKAATQAFAGIDHRGQPVGIDQDA